MACPACNVERLLKTCLHNVSHNQSDQLVNVQSLCVRLGMPHEDIDTPQPFCLDIAKDASKSERQVFRVESET